MEKRLELLSALFVEPEYVWFKDDLAIGTIDISNLTRSEAEEYAELMKQTFMKHWEEKQK